MFICVIIFYFIYIGYTSIINGGPSSRNDCDKIKLNYCEASLEKIDVYEYNKIFCDNQLETEVILLKDLNSSKIKIENIKYDYYYDLITSDEGISSYLCNEFLDPIDVNTIKKCDL